MSAKQCHSVLSLIFAFLLVQDVMRASKKNVHSKVTPSVKTKLKVWFSFALLHHDGFK